MLKNNKAALRGILFISICLLLLAQLGFFVAVNHQNVGDSQRIYSAAAYDIINQRLTSVFFEINIFPRHAGDDILYLRRLSSLDDVINFNNVDSSNSIKNLERDIMEFMKVNTAYYQLRFIDEAGDERVKVTFDGNEYFADPEEMLQNKKNRSYFQKTAELDAGEVFVSRLDLNVENGIIENRGTEADPEYIPVIRYGTPVFDNNNTFRGVVISNVYTGYFLEDIRRFQREGETVFLIDSEGYYLANPERDKEFAFMFGRDENFQNDYPQALEVISGSDKRRIETDAHIFSFKYVYPTAGNSAMHRGSEKILGKNPEEKYFWAIVSVSEKEGFNKGMDKFYKRDRFSLLVSGALVMLSLFLMFIAVFKI